MSDKLNVQINVDIMLKLFCSCSYAFSGKKSNKTFFRFSFLPKQDAFRGISRFTLHTESPHNLRIISTVYLQRNEYPVYCVFAFKLAQELQKLSHTHNMWISLTIDNANDCNVNTEYTDR